MKHSDKSEIAKELTFGSGFKLIMQDIREAISGAERDFTTFSLSRAILILSIPMVLEMMMESVFAVVDIYFVSKIGAEAVATVGITESIITLVYAIAVGLSSATTAIVSRRIGEKNIKEASNTALQAIITGAALSLPIAFAGILFSKEILMLMGLSQEVAAKYSGYTAVMLSGNIVIMLLFVINAAFRAAGDAAISMRVLWLANIINIILDPCLIFGWGPFPELGIAGAAIATNIGRGAAVIFQFYLLFRGRNKINLKGLKFKPDFNLIINILKLSAGSVGQFFIATSSWIGLMRIVSSFGSDVAAGYTIAIRIIIFALLPTMGLGNAASTLVGQNLGAGKPSRAESSVWLAARVNIIFSGIVGLILILTSEFWIRLFIADEAVVAIGSQCLVILCYGFISYGVGHVVIFSINGAGDTYTPVIINVICFWMLEIPLAYILSITFGFKAEGVFWAIVISESILTASAALVFRHGKWKDKKV